MCVKGAHSKRVVASILYVKCKPFFVYWEMYMYTIMRVCNVYHNGLCNVYHNEGVQCIP